MSIESLNRCYKNVLSSRRASIRLNELKEKKYNMLVKRIKKKKEKWISKCMESFYSENFSKECLMNIVPAPKTVDEVHAFLECMKNRKFELAHALIPLWEKMYHSAIEEIESNQKRKELLEKFPSIVEADFIRTGGKTVIHSPWKLLF